MGKNPFLDYGEMQYRHAWPVGKYGWALGVTASHSVSLLSVQGVVKAGTELAVDKRVTVNMVVAVTL